MNVVEIHQSGLKDPTTIDIPASITYEGKSYNVTSFELSGANAEECASVIRIKIPSTLKTFVPGSFQLSVLGDEQLTRYATIFPTQLPNLKYFYVDSNNPYLTEWHNQMLLSKDKSTLICCPPAADDPTAVVFTGIKSFGPYAFNGCKLKKLIIPASLENIDQNAFSGFSAQTEFANADKNPNKRFVAFNGVLYEFQRNSKGEVTNQVKSLLCYPDSKGEPDYIHKIDGYNTPTEIAPFAFDDVRNIGRFYLPSDVISNYGLTINKYAFYNCKLLREFLAYEKFVWKIGSHAFDGCTSLGSFVLERFSFQNGMHTCEIESYAFANSGISYVRLPVNSNPKAMLVTLDDYAFANCTKLKSIILPYYTDDNTIGAGLNSFGKYIFSGCTSLEQIDLSKSMPNYGNSFYGTVGVIPEGMFYNCSSLTDIKLADNSVVEIGDYAFHKCNLQSWAFSNQNNSLKSIGKYAFALGNKFGNTFSLNKLSELTSIGEGAFYNSGITSNITFYTENSVSKLTKIEPITFAENAFKNIFFPEGIKEIGVDFVNGNPKLEFVHLPNSLENIEWTSDMYPQCWYAEKGIKNAIGPTRYCENLNRIEIFNNPKYATSLHGLLYNKKTMELIHCPEDFKITTKMGYSDYNVKGLILENEIPGIKSIAPYCFARSILETIVLPSTLEKIGTGAFRGSNIKSLTIPANVSTLGSFILGGGTRGNAWIETELFMMPLKAPTIIPSKTWHDTAGPSGLGISCYMYIKKTSYDKGYYSDEKWSKGQKCFTYKIPFPTEYQKKLKKFSLCRDFDINCNGSNFAVYVINKYSSSNEVPGRTLQRYVPSRIGAKHDKYVGVIVQMYQDENDPNYVEDGNWYCIGEHDYSVGNNQVTRKEVIGEEGENNWLIGCPIPTYVSTYKKQLYGLKNNKFALYLANGVVPYNKAYLDLTDHPYASTTAAKEINITFEDDDESTVTDIDSPIVDVNEANEAEHAVYYTLSGVKVEHPTKGIYIRNGKKVVIK